MTSTPHAYRTPPTAAAGGTAVDQDALRSHYLFASLNDSQWAGLQSRIHLLTLQNGQRLFSHGQAADAFYVVRAGDMKLFRDSPQGLEKIMRLARNGQSFAESVLFSDPPRYPVHAEAVGAAQLAAVNRAAYLSVLEASFDTCRAVMAQMVQRIYAHWDEIEMLALHGSRARVARYLLGIRARSDLGGGAAAPKLTLPVRKVVIAGELGLAPETLSRAFRALGEAGMIRVEGAQVTLLDLQKLQQQAQF